MLFPDRIIHVNDRFLMTHIQNVSHCVPAYSLHCDGANGDRTGHMMIGGGDTDKSIERVVRRVRRSRKMRSTTRSNATCMYGCITGDVNVYGSLRGGRGDDDDDDDDVGGYVFSMVVSSNDDTAMKILELRTCLIAMKVAATNVGIDNIAMSIYMCGHGCSNIHMGYTDVMDTINMVFNHASGITISLYQWGLQTHQELVGRTNYLVALGFP